MHTADDSNSKRLLWLTKCGVQSTGDRERGRILVLIVSDPYLQYLCLLNFQQCGGKHLIPHCRSECYRPQVYSKPGIRVEFIGPSKGRGVRLRRQPLPLDVIRTLKTHQFSETAFPFILTGHVIDRMPYYRISNLVHSTNETQKTTTRRIESKQQ